MKNKKIVFAVLSAVLVVFYIATLWLGMNPKVGIEYRMYYITNELSDWPGYGNLSYELGTEEICTGLKDRNNKEVTYKVCQRKGQGFKKEQYDGSVSTGDASYIYYIPTKDKDNARLKLTFNEFTGNGKVSIYANDRLIGIINSSGYYELDAGTIDKDELLTIKMVTDNCSFRLWSTCLE